MYNQKSAIYQTSWHQGKQPEYQQKQQIKPQMNQVEIQELRFEVYQDLQNTINLFYSLAGALEYFYNDPNHPYVTTAINKLISQLNISNTIHIHQQNINQQNQDLKYNLIELNNKALKIFNEIIQTLKLEKFNNLIDFFRKNLSNNVFQRTLDQLPINRNVEFTQEVLERVISAMNSTDNIYKNIREGSKIELPTKEQVQKKAQDYKKLTLEQLRVNFPSGSQQQQQQPFQSSNNQKNFNFLKAAESAIQQSKMQPQKYRDTRPW